MKCESTWLSISHGSRRVLLATLVHTSKVECGPSCIGRSSYLHPTGPFIDNGIEEKLGDRACSTSFWAWPA